MDEQLSILDACWYLSRIVSFLRNFPKVIDRREVAEVAVPQVQDFEIVGLVEREGFPKVEVRAPAQRTGRIGRADVSTG